MSKEKDTQQTLLQEDSHANHSALQEREEEQTMTATSGMKLLGLLGSANRGGLLEKMLKELLTSKTSTVLRQVQDDLEKEGFQVQCLVIPNSSGIGACGIKGKEFGLLHTPTATEIGMRSKGNGEGEDTEKYRRKTTPIGKRADTNVQLQLKTQDQREQGGHH